MPLYYAPIPNTKPIPKPNNKRTLSVWVAQASKIKQSLFSPLVPSLATINNVLV